MRWKGIFCIAAPTKSSYVKRFTNPVWWSMNGRLKLPLYGVLLIVWFTTLAKAQTDGIESARSALRNQPWFDHETDGLKPIELSGEADKQRADWRTEKRPEWNWTADWPNWFSLAWVGEILRIIGWVLLFVVLGALIYALIQAFLRMEDSVNITADRVGAESNVSDEERIKNLPVALRSKTGNFLQIARDAYEAGNFHDAIVYLFSYRLIQLDRAGLIRLTKGKTNRQYLIELSRMSALQKILGHTTVVFEDVFFGKHTLTRERFESCWNRNQQFDDLVKEVMA